MLIRIYTLFYAQYKKVHANILNREKMKKSECLADDCEEDIAKNNKPSENILKAVSQRTQLPEGEEAVRRILREIYRHGRIGTKDLAYITRLPVPVVAAVRRELEKTGLIVRRAGAILTGEGEEYVKTVLGLSLKESLICEACSGRIVTIKNQFQKILDKMKKYVKLRPRPYTWLDQAFCTPETAVLRALFMFEEGDIEGRRIIFLGDDDLTSIAASLLKASRKITVIDIDDRLLKLIDEISRSEELNVECVHHDLRQPLPKELKNNYDIVFTDPPYTVQGLKLFLSRGIESLRKRKCASLYLAFAHKPPEEMLSIQASINEMHLFIRWLIPRFNRYEGAELFANTTFLAKIETTESTHPSIVGPFNGKIYTGEVSPKIRTYRCRCGYAIYVGIGQEFHTIEDLKARGCPKCGRKSGFRMVRKRLVDKAK